MSQMCAAKQQATKASRAWQQASPLQCQLQLALKPVSSESSTTGCTSSAPASAAKSSTCACEEDVLRYRQPRWASQPLHQAPALTRAHLTLGPQLGISATCQGIDHAQSRTSSSESVGATMITPERVKLNITLPASAIFPPPFCTAVRTSAAVLHAHARPRCQCRSWNTE